MTKSYEYYLQDRLYRRAMAARAKDNARCGVHLVLSDDIAEHNGALTPMAVQSYLSNLDGYPKRDTCQFVADFMEALIKHGQWVYDTYGPEAAKGYAITYDQPVRIEKWISFLSCFDDSSSKFLVEEFKEILAT